MDKRHARRRRNRQPQATAWAEDEFCGAPRAAPGLSTVWPQQGAVAVIAADGELAIRTHLRADVAQRVQVFEFRVGQSHISKGRRPHVEFTALAMARPGNIAAATVAAVELLVAEMRDTVDDVINAV